MRKDGMGVPGQPKHQRRTENILYPPSPCSAEEIESKEVDWSTVSKWGRKELQESDLPGVHDACGRDRHSWPGLICPLLVRVGSNVQGVGPALAHEGETKGLRENGFYQGELEGAQEGRPRLNVQGSKWQENKRNLGPMPSELKASVNRVTHKE